MRLSNLLLSFFLLSAMVIQAADITPGHSFTSNERVTADTMNSLVSGAAINTAFYSSKAASTIPSSSDVVLLYSPGIGYRQITIQNLIYGNTDLMTQLFTYPNVANRSNFLAGADSITISNFLNSADSTARSNFLYNVTALSWSNALAGFWSWAPSITNNPTNGFPQQQDVVLTANTNTGAEATIRFGLLSPAGSVIAFAGSNAPMGWLECNGAVISRVTYSNLFSAINTNYGVGDGSTTFSVPDLRGEFIRGWDHGKGTDTNNLLGNWEVDMVKQHTHNPLTDQNFLDWNTSGGSSTIPGGGSGVNNARATTGNMTSGGGTETRPRNFPMMYIIRW